MNPDRIDPKFFQPGDDEPENEPVIGRMMFETVVQHAPELVPLLLFVAEVSEERPFRVLDQNLQFGDDDVMIVTIACFAYATYQQRNRS